jgi:hypothetical protein
MRFLLAAVVTSSGSTNGGRDEKMFDCLMFNSRILSSKGIVERFDHLPLLH